MTGLVIIGASGHGQEVASCAQHSGQITGFIDDDRCLWGTSIDGVPVLGGMDVLESGPYRALLGVGYPEVKLRILRRALDRVVEWSSVTHPRATIGNRVQVARGVVIQAASVLTVDIDLEEFTTINVGCTINHGCRIKALATLSPGVHLGGNVTVEEGAFVGIGASVIQGVTLGHWSVVGAGATVIDDVPPNAVVAGVPARIIKTRSPGWQHS